MHNSLPAAEQMEQMYATITEHIRQRFPEFEGAITPEFSAGGQLALYEKLTMADTGRFVYRDGRDVDCA